MDNKTFKKQTILKNQTLIQRKETCVVSVVSNLSKYATGVGTDGSLELIQLHKGYCNFDGWSEESLDKLGFELLYAETPQKRVNDDHDKDKTYTNPMGIKITSGRVHVMPIHKHDKTNCTLTLKDKFEAILKDAAFRPLMYPKKGTPVSFKSPLVLKKLIMIYEYEAGKYDVYHWHKTDAMKDSDDHDTEVKIILTHVNEIEVGEIFTKNEHNALRWRIEKYAALISTDEQCRIKETSTTVNSKFRCLTGQ